MKANKFVSKAAASSSIDYMGYADQTDYDKEYQYHFINVPESKSNAKQLKSFSVSDLKK